MAGYRAARVSQRIHQEISLLCERQVNDPRLAHLNVTRVEVSHDLRHAKIFVAPVRDDEQATRDQMDALHHATGFFRYHLAHSLNLRFAPQVQFLLDPAIERSERFLQVLEELNRDK
jgi:ribosome-binding factor A